MNGHHLTHPIQTCGQYTARCQCGLTIWGTTLPKLWAHHDVHLKAVRLLTRRRHPSGGGHG